MYDIILKQNCGYKWHTEETLYAKGYIYYNNRIMSAIDFYKINKNNIKEIIKNVDGQFVIIDKCENIITIITDKSNSFPIYIDTSNKIIFDSYNKFNSTYTFSKEDCHDFLSMSRCFPGRTLIKNIFVSQCSSIYSIDKKSIIKKKYFKFERFTEDPTTFFDSLYSYIETYCKIGELIVVPLSGGYDSRLIINILSDLNIKNVITYYVGSKNYKSCDISKQLSHYYGYKWLCQCYNNNYWIKKFSSDRRKEFSKYCGGIHSVAHHLDWPIVEDQLSNIKEKKLYLSGMGGDFIAGSLYNDKLSKLNIDILKKELYEILVRNKIFETKKNFYMQIFEDLFKNEEEKSLIFENFIYEHRYTNGIFNAGKAYEFFSDDIWLYPLVNTSFIKSMFSLYGKEREHRNEFIKIFNKKYTNFVEFQTRDYYKLSLYNYIKRYFYKTILSPYFFIEKRRFISYLFKNCKYQNSISSYIELKEKGWDYAAIY